jgi:hypothetical protein
MARFVRTFMAVSTLVLVGISGLGLAPWLGHPAPVALAQFQFGGGQFGGSCGFNFGGLQFGSGCGFGGFSGGLNFGGGQIGGFNFGGGFNVGGCGGFQFSGQFGGIQFGGGCGGGVQLGGVQFGVFTLLAPGTTVEVGQHLPITFVWETPLPTNWHDLRTLELRLREESGPIAFWIRWDEATNTFSQIDPVTEQPVAVGQPGGPGTFEAPLITFHLVESAVSDTGPAGPIVALLLPISAKPPAEGRRFLIEERATNDANLVQGFRPAGTITVASRRADVRDEQDDRPRSLLTPQQRERTNRSGHDDVHTEGHVVATECGAEPPSVTIANRDGKVLIRLFKDAAGVCREARPGDYLEVDGEKVHEALFEAYDATVTRR